MNALVRCRTLAVLLLSVASVFTTHAQSQEAQKPPTKEECDSLAVSIGQTAGKLRSMPFRKLHEAEVAMFNCAKSYKLYPYSAVDATISQAMLERCEDFIHDRELDDSFFAWDEKLYGK
jgi:hypothetical protein